MSQATMSSPCRLRQLYHSDFVSEGAITLETRGRMNVAYLLVSHGYSRPWGFLQITRMLRYLTRLYLHEYSSNHLGRLGRYSRACKRCLSAVLFRAYLPPWSFIWKDFLYPKCQMDVSRPRFHDIAPFFACVPLDLDRK